MRQFLPHKSLGATLLLMIAGLTLIVALLLLREITASLQRAADIRRLQYAAALSSDLMSADESLAFERDVVLSLVNSKPIRLSVTARRRLLSAREEAISRSAKIMTELEFEPALRDWASTLRQRTSVIGDLRGELDRAINQGQAPPLTLGARWSSAAAGIIDDGNSLWVEFVRPYANIDASVTQELRYQNFLSLIYDYSGRERSLVTQVLSSPAHSDASQLINLQRGQGVLEVSWRSTFVLALQSGLYPDIQADYADAKSHYDAVHGMLEEAFYSPEAAQQGAFPLSAGLWLELSDQYLESLDTLREASRTTILNHVGRLARAADQAVVTQALLLVLTLGLCALGFWVVVVRVLRPIAGIINALVAATRGEPVNFSQSRARDDEIGKLVDVLVRFQQTLLDLRTTAANLDASERQLRAVVDNAVDGLITIDAKGLICSFNPACEHLFGYETAEVIGHNVSMLMPDPHRSSHDTFLARYNGSGEARVIGAGGRELLARRKNGTVFPIDLSVCGFKLSGEAYFSGIIRDITARKDAEAALIAHTGALERSNKELDDFAYIASHDLKEPLRGIHNHARFLLEDNGERLDEESVRRLNRLMALSQRMERLVNDLLYFSRIGRQELAIQPMDIGVVVRDIENTLEHFLEENHARIVLIEPLPLIVCDKTRVTELFRNLITNAVKYNDSEDKLIEIGVVEPRSPRSSAPVFFVRDNGRGIAPEFHDEVFRIFKRLKSVGKEAEGTGVGLTFVKKIVERHGGKIWIESSPGLGATFLFTLEANRHERTAEAA